MVLFNIHDGASHGDANHVDGNRDVDDDHDAPRGRLVHIPFLYSELVCEHVLVYDVQFQPVVGESLELLLGMEHV